jgi:hypothetical protein
MQETYINLYTGLLDGCIKLSKAVDALSACRESRSSPNSRISIQTQVKATQAQQMKHDIRFTPWVNSPPRLATSMLLQEPQRLGIYSNSHLFSSHPPSSGLRVPLSKFEQYKLSEAIHKAFVCFSGQPLAG